MLIDQLGVRYGRRIFHGFADEPDTLFIDVKHITQPRDVILGRLRAWCREDAAH